VVNDTFTSSWNSGQGWCNSLYNGAKVCTHQQLRQACNTNNLTLVAGRWMGDRAGDDQALVTNGTDCNNFDGVQGVNTSAAGTYCCLEFMDY